MVIDTSAVLAILLAELEAAEFALAVARAPRRLLSVANLLEASIVMHARFGEPGDHELDRWVALLGVELCEVSIEQVELARHAYRRYGKGRHPAGLNFGDCFAYALSKATGQSLLFKGGDFSLTDIVPASN